MLRLGVVGVGSLGFHHARILSVDGRIAMKGVPDSTRGAAAGGRVPARRVRPRVGRRAARRGGCVVIAVPTSRHEEVALAAIERGVHVLVEKPIAPTLEAADRIVDAADAAGVLVHDRPRRAVQRRAACV
jgi:UDP-N-acetylglucosamine 3-dehydrogenase